MKKLIAIGLLLSAMALGASEKDEVRVVKIDLSRMTVEMVLDKIEEMGYEVADMGYEEIIPGDVYDSEDYHREIKLVLTLKEEK